ncbi:Protein yellow, partial [Gryllus bimaculatus]
IDKCRRLWVIDCGVVDIGNTFQHKCPPQLLVFDLRTDKLIARHRFNVPAKDNETTFMLNVIAEQKGGFCSDDAFAYIADTGAFAMYVFSLRSKRSWRIESETFLPESNAERIEVNGSTLMLQDGVLGLALNDRDDYLYYHSFSSFQEGRVLKTVLQEEALFADGNNSAAEEFSYIGRRQSQSAGEALAMNSVMFFHQMATESMYCWDTSTEYTSDNHHVVEHDSTHLKFVTSVKSISQGYPEEIWAIDNNGQRVFAGEFKPNQPHTVNIVRGSASDWSSKCKGEWYSWIFEFCNFVWW